MKFSHLLHRPAGVLGRHFDPDHPDGGRRFRQPRRRAISRRSCPPTVNVTATYPGASAETLADTVADPIEEQINGVENMLYMSSQSTGDGQSSDHRDLQARHRSEQGPGAGREPGHDRHSAACRRRSSTTGIIVRKSSPDILMAVHMYSPDSSLDQQYIANYVTLHIQDALLRVAGCRRHRQPRRTRLCDAIWIDPDRAAARNLTVDDIVDALRSHNVQIAAGYRRPPPPRPPAPTSSSPGARPPDHAAAIRATSSSRRDAQGRHDAGLRRGPGRSGRPGLHDQRLSRLVDNGKPIVIAVPPSASCSSPAPTPFRRPTADQGEMARLQPELPARPRLQDHLQSHRICQRTPSTRSTRRCSRRSSWSCWWCMVFLQSWRAAIIPIIAIPVSLVGTFGVMLAFGFSLNNLSLFGLVLAIGIVVDDAIVVVENVERHLRGGQDPARGGAPHHGRGRAARSSPSRWCFMAVFIPAAFIPGHLRPVLSPVRADHRLRDA